MIKNSVKLKYIFIILIPVVISVFLIAASYKILFTGMKLYRTARPLIKTFVHGSPLSLYDDFETYVSENQYNVDILHYELSIDLHPESNTIIASAILTAVAKKNIHQIDLNFYDNFNITRITLDSTEAKYISDGKKLILMELNIISNDTIKIKIDYNGSPVQAGMSGFVFGEYKKTSLVYTLNEPTYASSWFPCNDFPSDKAFLDIHITNDSSQISVSNGILESTKTEGSRKTYNWKTIYPVSTYLICIYSSGYVKFNDYYISKDLKDTMDVLYYVLPDKVIEAREDFKETTDMIRTFSELYGEYPFIKEKYGIAEFLWYFGAMENQTITGVPPNFITGKSFYKDIFIHELSHHWWGNAIGPNSWKDIWLNEGFATYSEALYFEAKSGKQALISTMLSKKQTSYPGRLSDPGRYLFTSTVYNKGAWVLHMLRYEIGDSAFYQSLRGYFQKYKYSNASTQDFIEVCEKVSGENLIKFFKQWLSGDDYIDISYSWNYHIKNSQKIFTIKILQDQEENSVYSFPLEIELKFDSTSTQKLKIRVEKKVSTFEQLVDKVPVQVTLDPDNWLLANFHHEGDEE